MEAGARGGIGDSLKPTSVRSAIALGIGLVLVAIAVVIGVNRFRYRLVQSDQDLFRFLPQGDVTLFFANVAALRQAGYLALFEKTKTQQEGEYTRFVQQTGFDYTRDLDAVAGAADSRQTVFLLRGRFEWGKAQEYARKHGGSCSGNSCTMPTSTPGRRASFRSIQPDVLALAVSSNADAVNSVARAQQRFASISDAPVWIRPSHTVLSNPTQLPMPLRILAISLQSSDSVVLSLRPGDGGVVALFIQIDAACANAATADTARTQLESNTSLLKRELTREHKQPDPADLTGLLAAGTFQVVNKHLIGSWPVRRELLASLE